MSWNEICNNIFCSIVPVDHLIFSFSFRHWHVNSKQCLWCSLPTSWCTYELLKIQFSAGVTQETSTHGHYYLLSVTLKICSVCDSNMKTLIWVHYKLWLKNKINNVGTGNKFSLVFSAFASVIIFFLQGEYDGQNDDMNERKVKCIGKFILYYIYCNKLCSKSHCKELAIVWTSRYFNKYKHFLNYVFLYFFI